ncbi:DUF3923 family protein [Leuconostoc citreum]|uniref:DUF3923 family protein n=1 Tax=Leuconostoc citreum TaxID=33964 RepID=UPI00111FC688|nr:DUF3923 family protein [Leuconostoc citreum]MDY5161551.1 DUF3923 family protein [Leuconostoc citreum]MDY5165195.1 DUF3923 family protein [Leuconostoc citreum]TOY69990.1 DUF3923 domain-containing protein [Leuconostoc citreum]
MRHNTWLSFNISSIMLFLIISIFLWLRNIDGTGAIMNTKLRLLNIGVLFIFFAIVWLSELIVFFIIKHAKK